MKKDLTKITDLNKEEILKIIDLAFKFKVGLKTNSLEGKVVAMVFEKPSLRTKVAFEVAAAKLGAIPVYLTSGQIIASGNDQKGRESIPDIAKNLEQFSDLILARVYSHKTIEEIANNSKIPLLNGLCDKHHPTQALADLMAIIWHKKNYPNIKVAFVGDGNNVATSLMQICAIVGIHFSIATPPGYEIPNEEYKVALSYKSLIESHHDPVKAIKDADVIYTDTFISMGEEHMKEEKTKAFNDYQITQNLLSQAKQDCIFMHCLPAHRGEEVTDEVMDCPQSIVFDQAQCRLHIAKSLLTTYLSNF